MMNLFTVLPQPNITIGTLIINEPMCMLTNVIIAMVALVAYLQFNKLDNSNNYLHYWKLFFVTSPVAMLFAAFAHGFKWAFTPAEFKYVWLTMNVLGIVPTFFATQASLSFGLNNKIITPLVYTVFVVVAMLTIIYNNFTFVKIAATVGALIILYTHIVLYNTIKFAPAKLVIAGMLVAVGAIVVHSLKLSIHTWFNFKDLSHVLMAISCWVMFKGVNIYTSPNIIDRKSVV